ncbi:thioredoxin-like protein [Patellaria atrata CBS 101060]|uniref:Thioredoxin-like protein n=1 Tax=Patellaria atrata CBS 101060 TaxID=1346257 RepID=A0A9P4VTH8_9PEZI|nr:thioredoxin-like protein [Patellaria atrata CBS 101060]
MSAIDPKVAAIVDRTNLGADSDEDEDALISALEDDSELDAFRAQRLEQLHQEYTRAKDMRKSEHGSYTEIKDEKALMDITTSTKLCVVHFFKPDFNRCHIMDSHLENLAAKHFDTRFLRINVDNAPFLVVKLKVQVLPCVISFIDGVGVDRIIGFEGIGRSADTFTTRELERRLLRSNVLVREKMADTKGQAAFKPRQDNPSKQDDDDDWD